MALDRRVDVGRNNPARGIDPKAHLLAKIVGRDKSRFLRCQVGADYRGDYLLSCLDPIDLFDSDTSLFLVSVINSESTTGAFPIALRRYRSRVLVVLRFLQTPSRSVLSVYTIRYPAFC